MTDHALTNIHGTLETGRHECLGSWTLMHSASAQVYTARSVSDLIGIIEKAKASALTITPRGAGHSYADAALNQGQVIVKLDELRRVISWDPATGIMDVEPGVTVGDVCRLGLASGWWPAVAPGTQAATIGGCAAMNVHGKNHWKKGSFGEHVVEFDIATAAGDRLAISRANDSPLFHAAIGGAGMLGFFTRLRLRLMRVGSGGCTVSRVPATSLRDMFTIFERETDRADCMFGWIDGFASGRALGRGVAWAARVNAETSLQRGRGSRAALWTHAPVLDLAHLAMNKPFVRTGNFAVYMHNRVHGAVTRETSLTGFDFRLDSIPGWERVWYPLGAREFQAFVPEIHAPEVFAELLRRSQLSGLVPYLCSMKRHRSDAFLLSYVRTGYSLSLDYRATVRNARQLDKLLRELRDVVLAAGGRLYLAKDDVLDAPSYALQMGSSTIKAFLSLKKEHDPSGLFMSDLYRRVFAGMPLG